jgi:hypothetical protein
MSLEDKLLTAELAQAARLEEASDRMLLRHSKRPVNVHIGPEWSLPAAGHPRQRKRREWGRN